MPSEFRIGTCSWKYDSWRGLVYPPDFSGNHLQEYAHQFATVEIDQWFWSLFGPDRVTLPKRQIVDEYSRSVPENFRFTIKVPNSLTLTHFYRKKTGDPLTPNPWFLDPELFERFLETLEPLASRTAAFIFQFEYLNRQKNPGGLSAFLDALGAFLKSTPGNCRICLEPRNPNYLNEDYFQFLRVHQLGHVFSQGYYLPDVPKLYARIYPQLQGLQIVRLLGSDRQGIEKRTGKQWGDRVEPREAELDVIARMVRHMVNEQKLDLYLNVNNHYEGSAPWTIRRLQELLETIHP